MEGKKSQPQSSPRAILVFGAPCSGKTTFAEKFAKQFNSPHYELNSLIERYGLNRQLALLLLEQIAKTGKNVIIEGGLNTESDRDEIRNLFIEAGYIPSLIWIQTDVNTIKSRLKTRHKSATKAKNDFESQIRNMEAPTDSEAFIVLSGKHTFETQLKHVLHQLVQ